MLTIYQASIDIHGATISSNNRFKVQVEGAQDHTIMPSYPETSKKGIIHFISSSTSLVNLETTQQDIQRIIKQQMSNVCIAYA